MSTDPTRSDRPARLPRARATHAPAARAPRRPDKGLSRGMIAVLVATAGVGVLALVVGTCVADRGHATRARTHWNAPPTSARTTPFDGLRAQAETRAAHVIPGARLARLAGRQVDPAGLVDLDYGSASFDFVAPENAPAGAPCGVEEGIAWQGWTQRLRTACGDAALAPRCTYAAALARAFPETPRSVAFVLEVAVPSEGSPASGPTWTFWPLDPAGSPVAVPDDCAMP